MSMRRVRGWLLRFRGAWSGRRRDRDLAAEIDSHLAMHADDNIRAGMSAGEARRAAILKFGPVEAIKEDYRARTSFPAIDAVRNDVLYALRGLRQSPGYAGAAILSLALGIGANTAIFSILNSLLLRPLPVRDPQQLVALASDEPGVDAATSYPIWREVKERELLDAGFAWASDQVRLAEGSETRTVEAIWADGRFFDVLGVGAVAGRVLTEQDDRPGGGADGPAAVISYGLWQRQFGGADAIGRVLDIERVPFRIVGVAPAGFSGLEVGTSFDVILPLQTEPLLGRVPPRFNSATWPWLHISGRLRPGQAIEAVTAAFQAAQPQIRDATMPAFYQGEARETYLRVAWTIRSAGTGSSPLRTRYAPALFTLLAIVGLVVLIACANIANLQLARTAARRYELSVRSALGASRARLIQQQLIESFVLSIAGALPGYLIARAAGGAIVAQMSTWYSTPFLDLSMDVRVFTVTAMATVTTALLFGTAPALRAGRVEPIEAMKGRGLLEPGGRLGFGGTLVIAQVALSLVLVLGAALFVRSFAALAYRDLGFDRQRVVVAVLDVRRSATAPGGRLALYERLREAAASVAGVESAAASLATPLGNAGVRFTRDITLPGTSGIARKILMTPVSPDWFRTFGTRIAAGRDFDPKDARASAGVAIVNDRFVQRYLAGMNPLGQNVLAGFGDSPLEPLQIVGVVQDAAFISVRDAIEPTIYRPLAQAVTEAMLKSVPSISISVRATRGMPPDSLGRSLAEALARVDANAAVSLRTISAYLNAHYVRERLLALLSVFFGGLALLLAAVGLYGVTAYSVNRRRAEIAIRLALGARPGAVFALIFRRIAWLAGSGIAAGVLISVWMGRFVRTLLYTIDAGDRITFAVAIVTIAAVAALASWLPARRAAKLNAAEILRM